MKKKTLSIIIPCFNEEKTLFQLLDKIEEVPLSLNKQIVIIDDCSTDGTKEKLSSLELKHLVLYNDENQGKGYAIQRGLKHCSGDYIIIQDADLEYDPNDYIKLLSHIVDYKVVYGSRIDTNKKSSIWFYWGGILVTKVTNLLYGTSLTDQPTCYKLFKSSVIKSIQLQEKRFGFCSEITAKIARENILIKEIPINYYPRNKSQGKKINWKDGLRALYVLLKYY